MKHGLKEQKAVLKYRNWPPIVMFIKKGTKLTKYAVITRYPGEYDEITKEGYEESIKIVKECLE